jgi:pimeloyl-ACP methyl ester carboxylesterase
VADPAEHDRVQRTRRWMAGIAGLSAVGTVAGASAARTMTRRATVEDRYTGEDFGLLDADRGCVVTTPDGVDLAVREVGPVDAAVTVVFAHGFCMNMGSFHFQRRELARVWGDQVRMVFYDQRGHGKSGTAAPRTYTVAQLGCDLDTVLTVLAPRGSVILVGHSMGGMTVLSHARQFPRRYGTSIVGAAIISSAAEGLSRSPLGEVLQNPALEAARLATRYAPNLVHRGRGAVRSVLSPILQAASFGDSAVSPTVARYSEQMIHATPVTTMVGFLHALGVHDETGGLPVLAKVPTLIACGSADTLTLPEHSEEMAAVLPKAELLVVGGAGHLVQLEQPDPIDDALVRLVERATPNKLQALSRRVRERVRPLARSETIDRG